MGFVDVSVISPAKIPSEALAIVESLSEAGFAAYIVGGAVRDLLLGIVPKDFDVATNAQPEEVLALCHRKGWRIVEKLGANFGVVALVFEHKTWEVATFRTECYGDDAHRPETVRYTDSLQEDLARRDFTINAMALTRTGKIIDYFGGRNDLDLALLRTVGDPVKRFQEDALRLFRACRFAAQLGFRLEDKTYEAMTRCLERVKGLSLERVKAEINKLLLSGQVAVGLDYLVHSGLAQCTCQVKRQGQVYEIALLPELRDLLGVPQNPAFHSFDVWYHTVAAVVASSTDITVRWAALLHDVAKGSVGVRSITAEGRITDYGHDKAGATIAKAILTRLEFAPKFVVRISWLVEKHMRFHVNFYRTVVENDSRSLVHWLREEARSGRFRDQAELKQAFVELAQLCFADAIATGKSSKDQASFSKHFLTVLEEVTCKMPVHTSDLVIRGKEICKWAPEPQSIGSCLKILLQRVQDGELVNEKNVLLAAAEKWLLKQKLKNN
ncbi:MAG: CCA tRNA nucleotidyltransferase [Sporomusaceae bacterium]|nr:CCA tRNA nucleotidyltransferase [Sporomusaceae bacterium]